MSSPQVVVSSFGNRLRMNLAAAMSGQLAAEAVMKMSSKFSENGLVLVCPTNGRASERALVKLGNKVFSRKTCMHETSDGIRLVGWSLP